MSRKGTQEYLDLAPTCHSSSEAFSNSVRRTTIVRAIHSESMIIEGERMTEVKYRNKEIP